MVLNDLYRQTVESFATGEQNIRTQYDSEDGIIGFVRDVIGVNPHPYQEQALRQFYRTRRLAIRSGRRAGKSTLVAWVVLWAVVALGQDTKIVTIAPSWRQLTRFLWPEIRKWALQADWTKTGIQMRPGRELMQLAIRIPGCEAFAVTSDQPDLIEGAHAKNIVFIFDEAKSIKQEIWDATEGSFAGEGSESGARVFVAATSTPGAKSGRFYDIHSRRAGYEDWTTMHITLAMALASGQISQQWVDRRLAAWGEQSAPYQNYVLGEFADSGEQTLIPLQWIEAANLLWHERIMRTEDETEAQAIARFVAQAQKDGEKLRIGCDPAWKGADLTAIADIIANTCTRVATYKHREPMEVVGHAIAHAQNNKDTPIGVDTIYGAGVYSRLREMKYNAISIMNSEKAEGTDYTGLRTFANKRAESWWRVRDALDPASDIDKLALPDIPELIGDLTAPEYKYRSNGAIILEPKEDIQSRIGRSPDRGDALVMAYYVQADRGIYFW